MFERYLSVLKNFLHIVFGEMNYRPPAWSTRLAKWFSQTRFGLWLKSRCEWIKANPRLSARYGGIAVIIAAILGFGIYRGVLWYQSRPKPDYAKVTLQRPGNYDLENKKSEPLNIEFSQSVAPLDGVDKSPADNIELSPKVDGKWRWVNDRRIEFVPASTDNPKSHWVAGQKYTVTLKKKLVAKHILLEKYDYDFTAREMKAYITKQEFYQDPRDPKIKRALVNFQYNYPLDTEDFKKRLTMTLQTKDSSVLGASAKAVPFTVTFNKFQNEAYLQSDPIAIPSEDSVVKVVVEKGVRDFRNGNATADKQSSIVDVPGMFNYFRFEHPQITFARNERYEPEQVLVLNSKADIASENVAKVLEAFVLPRNLPSDKDKKRRHRFRSPSEITKEVRDLMKPLTFTLIPTETPTSLMHSFKTNASAGQFIYLRIPKGIKSFGGYELAQDFEAVINVPSYPKELLIMSQGSLLSLSGDKKIPLLSRNVGKVDFKISRILPDQLNQLIVQVYPSSNDFSHPNFGYFSDDTLAEKFTETREIKIDKPMATQYFSFDLQSYLNRGSTSGRKGLFYLSATEHKGSSRDERLILLTDIGVVVKETVNHTHDVFVQNIHSGAAVGGASVEVLGANGIAIMETRTGADGHTTFPDLRDFKNEKRPIAFVVKNGGDYSFLPYQMATRQLNFSNFDTGGIYESGQSGTLNAFLFSDRGIYRPGDTVNFGMIVRGRNWKNTFKDVPVTWSVTDARGTEILREKIKVNSSDMMALKFETKDFSPTGTYDIRVFITKKNEADQQIGSLNVRVEEFMPDRMRISTHLSQERLDGWVNPKDLKARVNLQNLFGTPAENRTIKATLDLSTSSPGFRSLREYQFGELNTENKNFSEPLETLKTDGKGNAEFDLNLQRFDAVMYRLKFEAEGFEAEGGRGVSASAGALVSPLPYLVGYRRDSDLTYLSKNSKHSIHLIAVNSELKKIAIDDLKLELIERRYISSLTKQYDGTYKYQSVVKEVPVETKAMKIAAGGTNYELPTEKAGDFTISLKNADGTVLNKIQFTVTGEGNLSRSLEKNAELGLVLNKKDYKPGEEIEMQIKAPYSGAGLITIERDRVFTHKWFKTSTSATVERIRIPEGVEGNAFVNVTFLRAIDSKEIFMSPLSFAVQPFSVSLDSHRVNIKLEAKELVKPGNKLRITYSADKPSKIILYGVNEGILQVAGYKLPDPLTYFFQRRALQVKTFQLLDLLLPEYSVLQSLSAPGGDSYGAMMAESLNPFKRKTDKPVVFWSGVINAGPEAKHYEYEVPDYFNGTIKVMAVAASNAIFGSTDKQVLVRGDFILSPNVPAFVAPGDEFEVSTGISNQAEKSGPDAKIKVELVKSDEFEIIGENVQTAAVGEGHEGSLKFRLKAKSKLGSAKVLIRASLGDKAAKAQVEFSIRPATPYISTLVAGLAEKSNFEIKIDRQLLPEFRKQQAGLSPVPAILIPGLKAFLDDFNYACTEQAVSKAMPYVLLKARPEFKVDAKTAADQFATLITLLRTRQTGNGGFGLYMPDQDNIEASLYALHLFLEAKDRGFNVPEDMLEKALNFAESTYVRGTKSIFEARQFAYAIYLRARAGRVPGSDIAFLHQVLEKSYKDTWKNDLAAAYLAATYKLVKQDDQGAKVFSGLSVGEDLEPNYGYYYDTLSRDTTVIYLAARHFPEQLKRFVTTDAMAKVLRPLVRGQYNTYSAAHALLILDQLVRNASQAEILNQIKIEEIQATGKRVTLSMPNLLTPADFSGDAVSIAYQAPSSTPMFYLQLQNGFDRDLPKAELRKKMEITRDYLDAKGNVVSKAKVGDELTVRLRVRALDQSTYDNIVLVDLLPGGFEPVLEKMAMGGGSVPEDAPDGPEPSEFMEEAPEPESGDEGAMNILDMILPRAWAEDAVKAALTDLSPHYVDRREDRMVIYGAIGPEAREFRYKIKAIAEGQFVVPPPFGESMYDKSMMYRGLSPSFTIEAP